MAQKTFVDTGQVIGGPVESGAYLPDSSWTLMSWGWTWDVPPPHPERVIVSDERKALGGPGMDAEGFIIFLTNWQDEEGYIRCWVLGDDGQP
jgi:hypothetical protein